ncbi:hypothetical protein AXFE_35240 [Acidithrix ferrooxidans]|uniref:Uncharacterized protein n=1 Tax=Acidithrix ferrooxidans TaxID=1280514 RepID=A0A0D8HCY0_9ACTN|nr:hypothetical protein AXFE_35240 [Acidithrix ferrooxidans]
MTCLHPRNSPLLKHSWRRLKTSTNISGRWQFSPLKMGVPSTGQASLSSMYSEFDGHSAALALRHSRTSAITTLRYFSQSLKEMKWQSCSRLQLPMTTAIAVPRFGQHGSWLQYSSADTVFSMPLGLAITFCFGKVSSASICRANSTRRLIHKR